MGNAVTNNEFKQLLAPLGPFAKGETIVVAVSGGADSMALSCLAQAWAKANELAIVGLTVDHRLREEGAKEAVQVSRWLGEYNVEHHTLVWQDGDAVGQLDRSPQAAAREARFNLMVRWCRDNKVANLLVAHHADDQAETFMQRLVRGSGLDGLAAMQHSMARDGIKILRPLLSRPKADLLATCEAFGQAWIDDPSNQDDRYTRVRLRNLLSALEEEGLDRDRLLNTVAHMQRAKAAIDDAAEHLMRDSVVVAENGFLTIDREVLLAAPDEVVLRCLARCLCQVSGAVYPPRFDSLFLVFEALGSTDWSDRTLHGCQMRVRNGSLVISLEAQERQNPC